MRTLLSLVGMIVVVAVVGCRENKELPVSSGPSIADSADQVFFTAEFKLTTNGIQRGTLVADTAYVLDDQTRIDLRRAHVVFTSETGAAEGTMDSDKGIYSTRTQILDGYGHAVVHLVTGRTLRSPHVTYNQLTHQLSSDSAYTITRGQDTQTGIGFTSNQTFSNFNCLRNCGGKMSVLLPER